MVLSKNNTKGNEVLLQNIVLQRKEKEKRKSYRREKKNGALPLYILKNHSGK